MERYEPAEIEVKWQRVWEDEQAFRVPDPPEGAGPDPNKLYLLEMLPYPSGRCTWATSSTTRWSTSWPISTAAGAAT